MAKHERYLKKIIDQNLQKKMVFIGGPRQVGKTTLALRYLTPSSVKNPSYLNWDRASDKSLILKDQIPFLSPTLVLDEIHKFQKWRGLIKGLYDKYHEDHKFIVTGSARLDYFRKGGDSLLGRYRYYRLHPFSLMELNKNPTKSDVETLLKFSGFPEPLFSGSEKEHRLWQRERNQKVISEDLRDLETVKDVSTVLMLGEILPSKVASPLSVKSLEEDLQCSQPTIQRWINLLSLLYYTFLVAPYGSPKIRAVKKLQKNYMWDWTQVEDPGARFENFVASHLLKYCHYIEDVEGHAMELRYLRDTDGREIDFVVLKNKKPIFAIECKSGDKNLSKHVGYFKARIGIPEFYQVHLGTADFGSPKTGRVLPFTTFCKEMGMV
jgi:uncharacterized protein